MYKSLISGNFTSLNINGWHGDDVQMVGVDAHIESSPEDGKLPPQPSIGEEEFSSFLLRCYVSEKHYLQIINLNFFSSL